MLGYFKEELAKIVAESKSHEHAVENFKHNPLVLYGFGNFGQAVAKIVIKKGLKIDAIVDKAKEGMPNEYTGIFISPEQLKQQFPDANIVICSQMYFGEIKNTLIKFGYTEKQFFGNFFNYYGMSGESFDDVREGYEYAYNFFKDELSKNIVLNRIKCFYMSSPISSPISSPMSSPMLYTPNQYFVPYIVSLNKDEVFVDAGLFDGGTIKDFISRVPNGQYKHIYGFECDSSNYRVSTENLNGLDNVTLVPKGLWNRETELSFTNDHTGSAMIKDGGGLTIKTAVLDSFFAADTHRPAPTFIKMDIEGAEKEALLGSEGIVRTYRPKLAICVYHKPEDIYAIPQMLYRFNPDYKFFLRHHSDKFNETVLYAI